MKTTNAGRSTIMVEHSEVQLGECFKMDTNNSGLVFIRVQNDARVNVSRGYLVALRVCDGALCEIKHDTLVVPLQGELVYKA